MLSLRLGAALLAGVCVLSAAAAASPAALDTGLNESVIAVPASAGALETTVFRPPGPGPFPLLIVNHGKAPGNPRLQARERFIHLARVFVARGYAVMVPMRAGFAHSGGAFVQHGCNMKANGYQQVDDIVDVLRFARAQPWVDAEHIVLAGQSFGGLATVAAATRDLPGVRGVLNFAGGLKVHGNLCDWQDALVRAFAAYGQRSRLPGIWLYGANDSYFGPALAARMHAAFTAAGGNARLVAFGPFQRDAHGLLASRNGPAVWLPEVERFLQQIGMPVRQVAQLQEEVAAPPALATRMADADGLSGHSQ